MELPQLGSHCSVGTCQQLDFLPINCCHCQQKFCSQHCQPESHDCNALPEVSQGSDNTVTKHACCLPGCNQRELIPVTCSACGSNFCLQHRHPPDHRCTAQPPSAPTAGELAHVRVKQIADSLPDKPKKPVGHKDPKLAAKVQLMKLKIRAVGGAGVAVPPPQDRCHLLVILPRNTTTSNSAGNSSNNSSKNSKSIVVFVDKHWTIGRVLDQVAELAKVPNRNNEGLPCVLQLFRRHDGSLLPAAAVVAALVSEERLYDGETLVLETTPRGTVVLEGLQHYTA